MHIRSLCLTYFTDGKESFYPGLKVAAELIFVFFFLAVRIVANTYYSYFWWQDMFNLLGSGKAHSHAVIYFYLVSNCVFYCLHLVWLRDILKVHLARLPVIAW
mmetsp:Transcript_35404/g.76556  ORF Transcript_35404/g.76556 Transcript_35404/m.76556 type:complete len:103 (+) Transcript_35404:508-816(+)